MPILLSSPLAQFCAFSDSLIKRFLWFGSSGSVHFSSVCNFYATAFGSLQERWPAAAPGGTRKKRYRLCNYCDSG
jgi:hypothetical protein